MSKLFKQLLAGAIVATSLSGCNLGVSRDSASTGEGYYFEGNIYDGVTSERLVDFTLTATQRGEEISADVNENGHFLVGPIQPDHDYVITIEADDYREFFAAESSFANLPNSTDGQETLYYEAFLFPSDIASPEVSLSFHTPDGIESRPSGTLRLTPTVGSALSAIHLSGTTTVASVNGQAWSNDADRRQRTVILEVADGEVEVEEGALVYGVTYTGTIFGSDGYTYESFSYTSGLEGDRTVSVDRLDPTDLVLVANSLEISNISESAEIVLTFNHPIELGDKFSTTQVREIIDDAFIIDSPDFDADGDRNILVSNVGDDPGERERGTNVRIDGNTLTFSWARDNSNFDARDGGDPIESVTYRELDQITLRLAEGRVDQEVNLATLLNATTLTVYVDGASATNPPPPLTLVSQSTDGTSAEVTYTFNRPIEYVNLAAVESTEETIDNNFSIVSPDADADTFTNTLPFSSSPFVQERGTSIVISGNTLTLSWDGTLELTDADDPITSVIFGALSVINIRPAGSLGVTEATTLGNFVGSSQTVSLTP